MKSLYRNKEVSWLSFNARVLQEAADPNVPLFERLRFLGIFSSNQDEFFRVRVATLKRLTQVRKQTPDLLKENPKKILKEVLTRVLEQQKIFDGVYQDILVAMAHENIFMVHERQLTTEQDAFVRAYFRREVRPKLIPLMLDQINELTDLRDQSIYLAVILSKGPNSKKRKYALIELPTSVLSRFLILPQSGDEKYVMFLDDVIRHGLGDIFHVFGFEHFEAYTIKLIRDSELDLDDDLSESIIKKVAKSLKQRKEGAPVRFVYDSNLPRAFLDNLMARIDIVSDGTLMPGGRYHNFRDFMSFPDFGLTHLKYLPAPPVAHPLINRHKKLLDTMETRDVMLHYPFQSFDYIIDLLRECSIDPTVTSIKMTIYRAAKNSSVINALINASRNGKEVVVVLEVTARFDEEANIYWGNRLSEEGAKVIYGVPGLKVHSKLISVIRKTGGKTKRYAVIGTGNFNEDTAKQYGDHALLTSDKRLTTEVANIFRFYDSNFQVTDFQHLVVSPFNTRKKLTKLISTEIKNHTKGLPAGITLKLNNLVDQEIIDQLYRASKAGVPIRLIVRSMFSLVAGIPSVSENIEAISIVDKYLEHTRIWVFENKGDRKYYITSADIMPRNLDRRVEVGCPIYDKNIQAELQDYLDIQWRDSVKARILDEDLENHYRTPNGNPPIRSQAALYDYFQSLGSLKPTPKTEKKSAVPSQS